jgi:hypothetical protein
MKNSLFILTILFFAINCNVTSKELSTTKYFYASISITDNKAKIGAKIPIIAWVGVLQGYTSIERYKEMRAAGISHCFTPFSDANAMASALDVAQKTGIKLYIWCPEMLSAPEATVRRFMKHPALAGYFLNDEPQSAAFTDLAALVKKIRAIDDKHLCYINLLPNYASSDQLGIGTYEEYLDKFINNVPVQAISFDHYPIMGNTNQSINPSWYKNLEMVATASKKSGKPFWAFALSVAFSPHPISTLAALRLQVFSDLAYGAQAIQYYTYWTVDDPHYHFNNAPITNTGDKTEVYARMQQINKEIIALSGVFLGAKMISVGHTGILPPGTKPVSKLPKPIKSLKTNGMGAVVSIMKKNQRSYLVVVNRDFTAQMRLTLSCVKGVSRISKNGSSIPQQSNVKTVTIEPGDIAIYSWSDRLN